MPINCEKVVVPHSADFCSSMTAGFGPDPALEVLEGLSINCSGRGTADFVGQGGLAEGTFLDKLCGGSATHR